MILLVGLPARVSIRIKDGGGIGLGALQRGGEPGGCERASARMTTSGSALFFALLLARTVFGGTTLGFGHRIVILLFV